jgi:hypothetical protein
MTPSLALVCLPRRVSALYRWRRRALLVLADTLPQRGLKVDRSAVLAEQVGERLVGQFLEILRSLASRSRAFQIS